MTKNATSKTTSKASNSTSAEAESTSERTTSEKTNASQSLHGAKSYGKTRDCHNTCEEDEQ